MRPGNTVARKRWTWIAAPLALAAPAWLSACVEHVADKADLSPACWDAGEIEFYLPLETNLGEVKPLAEGRSGLIAGSSSTLALRTGLEALKQGGSAADAALTAALTQIVMNAGATVSYAGVLDMVYYDAATGQVRALNAGFNTVLAEDDPLSIPAASFMSPGRKVEPGPRGRTVLVPGFMAGVQAAHDRFGVLPFGQLFQPAIYFAERGIPVTPRLARWIEYRRDYLSRLPETRAVFVRDDGEFHAAGDLLRQTALAETLGAVAREGADHMYRGAWAEKFVEAVREDGGKMTLEDLSAYDVSWSDPLHVRYRGYDAYSVPPAFALAGGLSLLEAGRVAEMGHYGDSPETLYWMLKILRAVRFDPARGCLLGGSRRSEWLDKNVVADVWKGLQSVGTPADPSSANRGPGHSSSIVAVDGDGNVAAVLHSINTSLWGESGLMIGGVSIPDAATFQQALIAETGPGKRLPSQTEPVIVLKDGRPVLATSMIGTAIDYDTIRVLFNALDFGMDPRQSLDAPSLLAAVDDRERVTEGDYSSALIEAVTGLGMELEVVEPRTAGRFRGSGVMLALDADTGLMTGSASAGTNGGALGY
jgi:gamma-glutamyltranspeptidase/glutathione hydrolase